MSLETLLQQDRRALILSSLDEAGGNRLSDLSVKSVLALFAHLISTDQVRTDLHWLEQQGLVRVQREVSTGGEIWMVQLLDLGQDVARGLSHPGVRRQAPKR